MDEKTWQQWERGFDWRQVALSVAQQNAEQAELLASIAKTKMRTRIEQILNKNQPEDPILPVVEVLTGLVKHESDNLKKFLERHEVDPHEDDEAILTELNWQAIVRSRFIENLAGSRAGDDS